MMDLLSSHSCRGFSRWMNDLSIIDFHTVFSSSSSHSFYQRLFVLWSFTLVCCPDWIWFPFRRRCSPGEHYWKLNIVKIQVTYLCSSPVINYQQRRRTANTISLSRLLSTHSKVVTLQWNLSNLFCHVNSKYNDKVYQGKVIAEYDANYHIIKTTFLSKQRLDLNISSGQIKISAIIRTAYLSKTKSSSSSSSIFSI